MSSPSVALDYRAFRLPRQGHGLEECQDALAANAEQGRFAIADGAGESPYSSLWAQLLVEEFVCQSERLPAWTSWLPSLQERWYKKVSESFQETVLAPSRSEMPWYLEAGLTQGAFATFLGLVIEACGWHAVAVGDSCLFQVRQDKLIRAFPVVRAADFSNAPWLVGSCPSSVEVPLKNGRQQQGDFQAGDHLLLMTDALAQWFLAQAEVGGKPWRRLPPLAQSADFAAWIKELRNARQLRNDDVTLVIVSL